jgi:hypothetical protein
MTEKLTVGQEVRVFDVNARRRGQPHDGWAGTITRVGRTLVYIDYPGSREPKAFRIDGGAANDQYGHQSFLTLDEAAKQARMAAAVDVLHQHGLRPDFGHALPLEQVEAIAAILRPDHTPEEG